MSDQACVLCNQTTDDAIQFGEKATYNGTTAHYYCLLLTSNLVQNGEDGDGISGFMPKDIKLEVSRTKRLFCHYCRGKGATIGCCAKGCRLSFHLPCAIKNNCRFEFTGTFQSFCDAHHGIKKPKAVHKRDDLCTVCYDEMGPYNVVQSIPLPCCSKQSWCHKLCLQKYAQTSGYFLKCPLCNDSDEFRDFIARRGVFIPDRDAKWEVEDTGAEAFYGFAQHSERPSECEALICICRKGRTYHVEDENDDDSMLFCDYCGSHAIHLGCLTEDDYICDECTTMAKQHQENAKNRVVSDSDSDSFKTAPSTISNQNEYTASGSKPQTSPLTKLLKEKYKIRECSVQLRRLTSRDLGFILESSNEFEISNTSTSSTNGITSTDSRSVCSSTDENEVEPRINMKSSQYILTDNENEVSVQTDARDEIHVKPKKMTQRTIDSYSESDRHISMNTSSKLTTKSTSFEKKSDQSDTQIDMNDNSKHMISCNPTDKLEQTVNTFKPLVQPLIDSWRKRHFSSSSEDEQIRPTGTEGSKAPELESSDDPMTGKENMKPYKQIAVVTPRLRTSSEESVQVAKTKGHARRLSSSESSSCGRLSSSDESIKPVNLATKQRQRLSSSDDSIQPVKPKGQKHRLVSSSDESVAKVEPKSLSRRIISSCESSSCGRLSSTDESVKPVELTKPSRRLSSSEDSIQPVKPKGKKRRLSSSDASVKPMSLSRRRLSSSGESNETIKPIKLVRVSDSDDSIRPTMLTKNTHRRFSSSSDVSNASGRWTVHRSLNDIKEEIQLETNTSTTTTVVVQKSPQKKRRRTVMAYLRNLSSDEEMYEPKPKRKSPKTKNRSPKNVVVAPNQSTIMHFFKKDLNQCL